MKVEGGGDHLSRTDRLPRDVETRAVERKQRIERRRCFVCAKPQLQDRFIGVIDERKTTEAGEVVNQVGLVLYAPVCAAHLLWDSWPPEEQATADWMVVNGYGKPHEQTEEERAAVLPNLLQ